MTRLSFHDFHQLQNCISEIYSHLDIISLPAHIMSVISKVIPSSVSSYATVSQIDNKIIYNGKYSCRKWEDLGAFSRCMHEHPLTNFLHSEILGQHRFRDDIEKAVYKRYPVLKRCHYNTVARISDVLTIRQFRSLAVFNDFFRPNGVEYQLLVSLLPDQAGYTTITCNRDKIDFSEKERLILNLLLPHVIQAHQNAKSYEEAKNAFTLLERLSKTDMHCGLTNREEEVIYWVAQGKTNWEVATILNVAPGTVKIHLERIYQKLGVENRTSAAILVRGDKKQLSLRNNS